MLDFILGLYLAGLLVRGWIRGLVREAFDLVGLIAGTWIAFRLSAPLGDFLTQSFGVTPEAARIGAGIALFLLFGIALSVAAGMVTKVMSLPGLNLVNRVGGAGLAVAWGVVLLVVVLNVARAMPLPADWEVRLDGSVVVDSIAGPEALPQRLFVDIAGDTALSALHAIQRLFGSSRIVPEGDQVVEIPSAAPDEVRQVRGDASLILEELNRFRAGEDLRPVVDSDALRGMAEVKALDSYVNGRLSRDGDCAPEAEAAGALLSACVDVVALAGTALGGFDGILDSDEGRAALSDPGLDRAGIAVVEGPTGRLLVIVLGR
jgi:uncharacterized membrane protein required for colicin V production/uncharacterized protein YkwD